MKTILISFFLSFFILNIAIAQIQIGQVLNGDSIDNQFGEVVSISANGKRIAVTSPNYKINSSFHGLTQVFEETNGAWKQVGKKIIGGLASGYRTNVDISGNGDRIVVGYPSNIDVGFNKGMVCVYKELNGDWAQIGQNIYPTSGESAFGRSIAISEDGKRVAIGMGAGNGQGRVKIFEENIGAWNEVGSFSGKNPDDELGYSVSISSDGKRVAAGAPEHNNETGYVYLAEDQGIGNWPILDSIIGQQTADWFGTGLAISADGARVIIGAPRSNVNGNLSGTVSVFEEQTLNLVQTGQSLYGTDPGGYFGESTSISGDGSRIVIGAYRNGVNGFYSGYASIYQEINGLWKKIGQDFEGLDQYLGWSVDISSDGSRVVISSPGYNNHTGRVQVYSLKGTYGSVYLDINKNCTQETTEVGIAQIPVVVNPGNYYTTTDDSGQWFLELPAGTYSLTVDTSMSFKTTCFLPQTFTVFYADSLTQGASIGLYSQNPCPAPDITIHMPFMRPCFSDQLIWIKACNTNLATGTLNNATAIVTLDTLLLPTSFELPYIDLGNNQYEFDLDSLVPGQCKDFWIKATLDCAAVLGQSLCMQAELFPVPPCVLDSIPNPFPPIVTPCPGEWDESSLIVEGYCDNGTIYFEITNIGVGNMTCYSPVTVYVDGILHLVDSVKLDTYQVATYSFPGNGESWHLEVDQHPNHPGNSQPKATVENCGGTTAQTLINLFAQDDADPIIDIYCGEVTGSYDPNDKTGYPIGVTADHYIEGNQQIQYRIRFQNTGTDTAFTVVIRDTLDSDLDLLSVRSGVSSHAYSFQVFGQGVLEWTFNDIMLPDSNVNEPLSHGFVLFTVDQKPNLPEGTQITNSAGIYFDFNAPIITNIAQHEVHYEFPFPVEVEEINSPHLFTLYPNPSDGLFFIDLKEIYQNATLTVTDITGRIFIEQEFQNALGIPVKIDSSPGIYIVEVTVDGGKRDLFKVVKY